jgi:hypothetical protein
MKLTEGSWTGVVFMSAFVAILVVMTLLSRRATAAKGPVEGTLIAVRMRLYGFVLMVWVLWLLLPNTSVLSSFGYPGAINEVQSPEQLLKLFQDYNRAIVRAVSVLHYFLLAFAVWFLWSLHDLNEATLKICNLGQPSKSGRPDRVSDEPTVP